MIKTISILFLGFLSSTVFAAPVSICGTTDDRVLSYDAKIGRLSTFGEYKGCTATLISDGCAITAGHCLSTLDVIEFNTVPSKDGKPVPSNSNDIYKINKKSIVAHDGGPGNDYAVFKIDRHATTGKLPGAIQGYYNVSFEKPKSGQIVRITGYGAAYSNPTGNFAQQTHTGAITSTGNGGFWVKASDMGHTVDTMGGNSGSSIILEKTNQIIGIHTHGGCHARGGSNQGTLLSTHAKLKRAIQSCLESERR